MLKNQKNLGEIQWILENSNTRYWNCSISQTITPVPSPLRTLLDKKTSRNLEFRTSRYLEQGFCPMDDFVSLSRTIVKIYCKNSNGQCFDSIFVYIFAS